MLSYERQEKILEPIASLAENMEEYSQKLMQLGFSSFLAKSDFGSSFCEDGELATHNLWLIEFAKRKIGSPSGLMKRRDEPLDWQSGDPCIRRFYKTQNENPIIVFDRREEFQKLFFEYRSREKALHSSTSISEINSIIESDGYASFFRSVLLKNFAEMGFSLDHFRSQPKFPVVSKNLTKYWDICWSAVTDRTLKYRPIEPGADMLHMTDLNLQCYVRLEGKGGFAEAPRVFRNSDIMVIRVDSFVSEFFKTYGYFYGVEELEVVISAYANLYKMVSEDIERKLIEELELA